MTNHLKTFQPEGPTHEASEQIAPSSRLAPSIHALLKPQNYSQCVAGVRLQTSIKAEKPSRFDWWTIRPDTWFIPEAALVEVVLEGRRKELYLVQETFREELARFIKVFSIFAGVIKTSHTLFLLPVPVPGEDAFSPAVSWALSLREAAETAQHEWIRIEANMSAGGYQIRPAQVPSPLPDWAALSRQYTLEQLLEMWGRGRVIDREDHPVLRHLRGG